eukprot:Skav203740  [mRNA]  locus=scaffold68:394561:404492:+ [translate_table: standard]
MAAGQTSSTYSFSSAPKAVTRKKYREPGDVEPGLYRSVKETCISWDKRVHRGNTYSMYTQNAIKEAGRSELESFEHFLPGLFQKVQQKVSAMKQAQLQIDEITAECVAKQQATWADSLQRQRAKSAELQKLHLEELQIRRGKIRILIDDGSGNPVPVGPIQLSSADSVEELQERVYAWLKQNEPKIAAGWPHGVVLKLSGEAVQQTNQLFEAKPGQISMGKVSEGLVFGRGGVPGAMVHRMTSYSSRGGTRGSCRSRRHRLQSRRRKKLWTQRYP